MLIAKLFLAVVGLMYLGLAVWCSLMPVKASKLVGFELTPGSGQSEFLVIYGGLELGIALIFLMPLVREDFLVGSLTACILVHACLVAYRTASFFLYKDFASITYRLAIGEWIILALAILCAVILKTKS